VLQKYLINKSFQILSTYHSKEPTLVCQENRSHIWLSNSIMLAMYPHSTKCLLSRRSEYLKYLINKSFQILRISVNRFEFPQMFFIFGEKKLGHSYINWLIPEVKLQSNLPMRSPLLSSHLLIKYTTIPAYKYVPIERKMPTTCT
jgi:hypothetical protein